MEERKEEKDVNEREKVIDRDNNFRRSDLFSVNQTIFEIIAALVNATQCQNHLIEDQVFKSVKQCEIDQGH